MLNFLLLLISHSFSINYFAETTNINLCLSFTKSNCRSSYTFIVSAGELSKHLTETIKTVTIDVHKSDTAYFLNFNGYTLETVQLTS